MELIKTDLYEYFGFNKPENAEGELVGIALDTPKQLIVERRRPAILILPGGAYRFTSDRESDPVALRFAARGYAAFVLHYSCKPHSFPTSLREAAMAMRFIRENAEKFHVDPSKVAALGFSAGGHLCGTLGTMFDCTEISDIAPAETVKPDALILCYPVSVSRGKTHEESFVNISGGDESLRDRLSLDKLIRADMPPVFLWHTRTDDAVPCRGSILLAEAMEDKGVDFAFHMFRQGRHGLSVADKCVYPSFAVPPVSTGLPDWPEEAMGFLADLGFSIFDKDLSN